MAETVEPNGSGVMNVTEKQVQMTSVLSVQAAVVGIFATHTTWKNKMKKFDHAAFEAAVREYIEDYEMLGETTDGRDAYYTPNENDKALLLDAFMGFDFSPWLITAQPVCPTCHNQGMVGGPSFHTPDEGGIPCPDCNPPVDPNVLYLPACWVNRDDWVSLVGGPVIGKLFSSGRQYIAEHNSKGDGVDDAEFLERFKENLSKSPDVLKSVGTGVKLPCDKPPRGWRCTREFGHDGPCAAILGMK